MSIGKHLQLPGRSHFRYVETCGSTNALALEWIEQGAPDGALVLCDEQKAGRGRRGRDWHSPPACNLYLSRVVWGAPEALPLLPLTGALAAREAVEAFLPSPIIASIKWPNDIWVNGGKIAGILAERGRDPSGKTSACALGLGINVNVRLEQMPGGLRSPATSLREICGHDADRQALLVSLVECLDRWTEVWRRERDRIAPTVAAHCLTLGRRVQVSEPGRQAWAGTAQSMEADGRLLIRDEDGRWRRLDAAYVDPC